MNFFFPNHLPEEGAHFGFWGAFLPQTNWLSQLLAPGLVFAEALLLNAIFNRNDFLDRNTYTPSLLYVTLLSTFHIFYYLDGFAIAQFCLVMAVHQLFQLQQNEDGRRHVFNVGFWLGLACSFHPILVLLIVVAFWLIWVIRPFIMRESGLLVVGFLLPLMYGGFYSAWVGIKIQNEQITSTATTLNIEDVIVVAALTFFFILLSLGTLTTKIQQSSIRLKKLFRILLILVIFTVVITIFEYLVFTKREALAMAFVPLMFVLPYGFGFKKLRDVSTIVFYLLFLFSVGRFVFPLQLLELG